MPALPSLPTEIWVQIFEDLCAHCQLPEHSHDIPDFTLHEAREGKAALKSLCLVSREFRTLSQDILFHYFFNFSNGGNWNREVKDWLPSFLRVLIANPSLGGRVRIMGLFKFFPPQYDRITRQDLQSWTDVSAKYNILVPGEVTEALLQKRHKDSVLFFNKPGPDAQLQHSGERSSAAPVELYRWLHILALNLVPRITHLQLERPLGSFEDLQSPAPTFTQLRVLTYDKFRGMEDVIESHIHFPNVSGLRAGYHMASEERTIKGPIPTMNIRKLSVFSTPRALSLIFQFCPNLEDLECHAKPCSWLPEPVSSLEWPTHTKNTLRRLAWSNQDAMDNLKNNDVDGAYIAPLLHFKKLEILEIDQPSILLYSKLIQAKGLSSVLPGSLRILHIAFAREVLPHLQIGRQLRGLVHAKATFFPRLSIVKVDDRLRPLSKKKTLPEYMNTTGIVGLLERAGIDLKFGADVPPKYRWSSRTILPPPLGVAERDSDIVFQDEIFSLDDLELL
ncbi:hypothetical protein LA080_011107 [Diaporthe eres]|nr:hypothetical protein LA080_011107 [Diaporthe eres]